MNVFHVETVLNNRAFGPESAFLSKQEETFSPFDWAAFHATRAMLARSPRPVKRKILHQISAPYEPIAIHPGETVAVHERTLAYCYAQYCVPVDGQADVMIAGIPYLSPYNIDAIMNPLLVQVMALAYTFHMYRGRPWSERRGDDRHPPAVRRVRRRAAPLVRRVFPSSAARRPATPSNSSTAMRRSFPEMRATASSTALGRRTTVSTRSICGTGVMLAARTSAR